MTDVTRILHSVESGDAKAADQLLPLVYDELRKLAAHKMVNESPGQTLQPTALVHEAWLRLVGSEQRTWQNRAHFFGAAAEAMRRILIDRARRKRAMRHGGGQKRGGAEDVEISSATAEDQRLALNEAPDKVAMQAKQKAGLGNLPYLLGVTTEVAARMH